MFCEKRLSRKAKCITESAVEGSLLDRLDWISRFLVSYIDRPDAKGLAPKLKIL